MWAVAGLGNIHENLLLLLIIIIIIQKTATLGTANIFRKVKGKSVPLQVRGAQRVPGS